MGEAELKIVNRVGERVRKCICVLESGEERDNLEIERLCEI